MYNLKGRNFRLSSEYFCGQADKNAGARGFDPAHWAAPSINRNFSEKYDNTQNIT
jgi:hypothetical protein